MIDAIKGAWEWIAAVGAAVLAFVAYGWYREQQGAQSAKATMKVEKAKKERVRAEKKRAAAEEKIEAGTKRQERARRAADRLEVRSRRRMEEAAVEMGKSPAEARQMSDKEIADAVGG